MPRKSNRLCLAAVMVMMLCSGLALAQQNEVFFTGPSNTIQRANFATSTATPVYVVKGSSFKGLDVREDGVIVVANATKNSTVMGCATTCQNIIALDKVAAVALSNRGDLFAVNSSTSGNNLILALERRFGSCSTCLPFGYVQTVPLKRITTAGGLAIQQLVDVTLARSSSEFFQNGWVLVLSQRPAMIFALPPDLSGNPIVVVPNSKFAGLTPNGLEIGPAGTFLVTTKEKVIAQFDYFGNRIANFNVAALPGSGINVTAGLELPGPAARAYVSIHDGSRILRLNENGVVTGQITIGIAPPYGIACSTTNSYAPTAEDFNVGVSTSSINTTWEQVNVAGFSSALCTDLLDPRLESSSAELVVCVKPNGDVQVDDEDFACTPGTKRVIPSFMRGWRRVGPGDDTEDPAFPSRVEPPVFPGPSGPFTIRLCQVDYSAPGGFEGLIVDESIEETWLGYDPGHPGGSLDHVCVGGPRSFYATSDGEPQLITHPFFEDVAISCGINLSGSWGRSFLLPTVRDLREIDTDDFVIDADDVNGSPVPGFCDPAAGSLDCKLAALLTLANVDLEGDHPISSNNCRAGDGPCCVSDAALRVQLATHLVEARLAVDQARRFSPGLPCTEDYEAASAELEQGFIAAIEAAGTAPFAGCETQFPAQLRARAMSANFLLTTLLDETETEVCE